MKLLGKGGSSRVYEAFDEQKNIVVAIKRVDLSNADEAQAEGKIVVLKFWIFFNVRICTSEVLCIFFATFHCWKPSFWFKRQFILNFN